MNKSIHFDLDFMLYSSNMNEHDKCSFESQVDMVLKKSYRIDFCNHTTIKLVWMNKTSHAV